MEDTDTAAAQQTIAQTGQREPLAYIHRGIFTLLSGFEIAGADGATMTLSAYLEHLEHRTGGRVTAAASASAAAGSKGRPMSAKNVSAAAVRT